MYWKKPHIQGGERNASDYRAAGAPAPLPVWGGGAGSPEESGQSLWTFISWWEVQGRVVNIRTQAGTGSGKVQTSELSGSECSGRTCIRVCVPGLQLKCKQILPLCFTKAFLFLRFLSDTKTRSQTGESVKEKGAGPLSLKYVLGHSFRLLLCFLLLSGTCLRQSKVTKLCPHL